MKNSLIVPVVHIAGLSCCAGGAFSSNSSSETSPVNTDYREQCPTWFFWNVSSMKCECHPMRHIHCSQANGRTWLDLRMYCMTYDNGTESTATGFCPYGDLEAEHGDTLLPENRSKRGVWESTS